MNTQELSPGRYARDVLLLGIGNILWADEGFGPRAAEAFNSRFRLPEGAEVMDGGTLGGWLVNDEAHSRFRLLRSEGRSGDASRSEKGRHPHLELNQDLAPPDGLQ